jgi:hypothetical protein
MDIRGTLGLTKQATFCVELPSERKHGLPTPTGTGFFISSDGWFVTAAHVITEDGSPGGPIRSDIDQGWLMKEGQPSGFGPRAMCQFISFGHVIPEIDVALLRVDFEKNAEKEWLKGKIAFPHLTPSARELDEGEPIYAFGYPLSSSAVQKLPGMTIGETALCPRVTSAIISAKLDQTRLISTNADPKVYVLDKALNYGNSGGPIVATDSGHVHALCSRFQPVGVPQPHLKGPDGKTPYVVVPSLYGIVSRLDNGPLIKLFEELGITVSDH